MAFDVKKHLMKVTGKDYLPVAWRLVWFREEKPLGRILTTPLELNTQEGIAIFQATVMDENGNILSMGTKCETRKGFSDFIEKAETGAIGRALAAAGYGTQFEPELDEGDRLADAPQETRQHPACRECGGDILVPVKDGGQPIGPLDEFIKKTDHRCFACWKKEQEAKKNGNGKTDAQETATRRDLANVIGKIFSDKTKFKAPAHGANWLMRDYGFTLADLVSQPVDMLLTIKEAAEKHELTDVSEAQQ